MSAEYTVPALRDTANELRSKAAAHYAAEEIKARQIVETARRDADAMSAAAAEIDADADAKEQRQRHTGTQQETSALCRSCGYPLVRDELGWRHADREAGSGCRGEAPPVPAPPTAPVDTLTDGLDTRGEVAQP